MTEREWAAIERMNGFEFIIGYPSEFCGRYKFEVNEDTVTVMWNQQTWSNKLSDVYVTFPKSKNLGAYDKRFLREAYDIVFDPNFKP